MAPFEEVLLVALASCIDSAVPCLFSMQAMDLYYHNESEPDSYCWPGDNSKLLFSSLLFPHFPFFSLHPSCTVPSSPSPAPSPSCWSFHSVPVCLSLLFLCSNEHTHGYTRTHTHTHSLTAGLSHLTSKLLKIMTVVQPRPPAVWWERPRRENQCLHTTTLSSHHRAHDTLTFSTICLRLPAAEKTLFYLFINLFVYSLISMSLPPAA